MTLVGVGVTLPIWTTCWPKTWIPPIQPTLDQLPLISRIKISRIKISGIKIWAHFLPSKIKVYSYGPGEKVRMIKKIRLSEKGKWRRVCYSHCFHFIRINSVFLATWLVYQISELFQIYKYRPSKQFCLIHSSLFIVYYWFNGLADVIIRHLPGMSNWPRLT